MAASELRRAHEIVKDRLYYVALRSRPRDTAHEHFFSVDSALVYWNFFLDFGPLNFAQVRFVCFSRVTWRACLSIFCLSSRGAVAASCMCFMALKRTGMRLDSASYRGLNTYHGFTYGRYSQPFLLVAMAVSAAVHAAIPLANGVLCQRGRGGQFLCPICSHRTPL